MRLPTPNPDPDAPARRDRAWLDGLVSTLVVVACCVPLSNNLPDHDLWDHVQFGRDLLRDGVSAKVSYAAVHRQVNPEILGEIALATMIDQFGDQVTLIAKSLLGAGLLALIVRRALSRGCNRLTAFGCAILTATNLMFFWNLRPQLFSYVFFTMLILLLEWCFTGWSGHWWFSNSGRAAEVVPKYDSRRLRHLWLAPLLFFLWANTHGGFVAGLAIYALYLTMRSIEALHLRGRQALGLVRRFTLMSAAALAGTMINPYGPGLHFWLLASPSRPQTEFMEWSPFWVMSAVTALGLAVTVRRALNSKSRSATPVAGLPLDATHLVILACVYGTATSDSQSIPMAVFLSAFWLPIIWDQLVLATKPERLNLPKDRFVPRRWKAPVGVLCTGLIVLCAMVLREQTRALPSGRDLNRRSDPLDNSTRPDDLLPAPLHRLTNEPQIGSVPWPVLSSVRLAPDNRQIIHLATAPRPPKGNPES